MAKEIERKFLTKSAVYREMSTARHDILQGYLSLDPRATVRVRIIDNSAKLTVKGITEGASRNEWEYEIPLIDAYEMLTQCTVEGKIEKSRYIVPFGGHIWEIDEFRGSLAGLVLAEVELKSADETIEIPDFIGEEVTSNPAYYNSVLAAKGLPE